MFDYRACIGRADVVFITLDTLRYDVAQVCHTDHRTPNLSAVLPPSGWQRRHSPGSFTYAAHAAFFAGFLPTPARPGRHPRPFALRFPGSETTTSQTAVFDTPDLISGFAQAGYHTLCIGGVGFFNKQSPLGLVFPNLFAEAHWNPSFGVTEPQSMENQFMQLKQSLEQLSPEKRVFAFWNVSAIHQPNCYYLKDEPTDSLATHAASLEYVDGVFGEFTQYLIGRGPTLLIICSDHGTAYGDDGYTGHRLAHPVVWDVPYAECYWDGLCLRGLNS